MVPINFEFFFPPGENQQQRSGLQCRFALHYGGCGRGRPEINGLEAHPSHRDDVLRDLRHLPGNCRDDRIQRLRFRQSQDVQRRGSRSEGDHLRQERLKGRQGHQTRIIIRQIGYWSLCRRVLHVENVRHTLLIDLCVMWTSPARAVVVSNLHVCVTCPARLCLFVRNLRHRYLFSYPVQTFFGPSTTL
jgi:hypothetical protein